MFGALMTGIAQDFVKYVMHVQVIRKDVAAPVVQNVQESSFAQMRSVDLPVSRRLRCRRPRRLRKPS